jgi:hypothetical protein
MVMRKSYKTILIVSIGFFLINACISQPIKTYSFDSKKLTDLKMSPMMVLKTFFPDTTHFSVLPAQEVALISREEFKVELTNCSLQDRWSCRVEDSVMNLLKCDTLVSDSNKSLYYTFSAQVSCKGSILFMGSNNRELIISYTCNPMDSLWLSTTDNKWIIDTSSYISELLLYISGKTNACKVKVEQYGDGVLSAVSLYPNVQGNFSDTIPIAFMYDPTHKLIPITDTRIALYGSIGLPKISIIHYSPSTSVENKSSAQLPNKVNLCQNYPNPFNPNTKIGFYLSKNAFIKMSVANILGQEITTIAAGVYFAGYHEVNWMASNYPSGMYFCRLSSDFNQQVIKMLLLK